MSSIYSALLAHATNVSGDSSPFIVPDTEVWVIRDISLQTHDALVATQASITGIDAATIWSVLIDPPGGYQHVEGRWVVEPFGGFFQLHSTFPVDWYVSGYKLSLP